MRFWISRTSGNPVEGAKPGRRPRYLTFRSLENASGFCRIRNLPSKPVPYGDEFRVRLPDEDGFYMDLNSIAALERLCEKEGEVIVSVEAGIVPTIEIYDAYRE